MKKRLLSTKLVLNKETIINLTKEDMREFHGGAVISDIGVTCYTGRCCYSRKECGFFFIPTLIKC